MTKHWMMQATDYLEFQNLAFTTVRNVLVRLGMCAPPVLDVGQIGTVAMIMTYHLQSVL